MQQYVLSNGVFYSTPNENILGLYVSTRGGNRLNGYYCEKKVKKGEERRKKGVEKEEET